MQTEDLRIIIEELENDISLAKDVGYKSNGSRMLLDEGWMSRIDAIERIHGELKSYLEEYPDPDLDGEGWPALLASEDCRVFMFQCDGEVPEGFREVNQDNSPGGITLYRLPNPMDAIAFGLGLMIGYSDPDNEIMHSEGCFVADIRLNGDKFLERTCYRESV